MNRICLQLGCGEIMFNELRGLCTGSDSLSLGLIVTAWIYCLLYSFQSPCGSSYEGAVYVVFKMVLQLNTCKLMIWNLAHGHRLRNTCIIEYGDTPFELQVPFFVTYKHFYQFISGEFCLIFFFFLS